mmetsp:Transcript_22916/g.32068  ORF Transcript_22916/g.32068 Transcript_22916/m.32068 type:complete len:212 (-) Transcript_22916:1526-2161(-)
MINHDENEHQRNYYYYPSNKTMQSSSKQAKSIMLHENDPHAPSHARPMLTSMTHINNSDATTSSTNFPFVLRPPQERSNRSINQQQPWSLQPRHNHNRISNMLFEDCGLINRYESDDHPREKSNHTTTISEQHKTSPPMIPSLSPEKGQGSSCNPRDEIVHHVYHHQQCHHYIPSLQPRYNHTMREEESEDSVFSSSSSTSLIRTPTSTIL